MLKKKLETPQGFCQGIEGLSSLLGSATGAVNVPGSENGSLYGQRCGSSRGNSLGNANSSNEKKMDALGLNPEQKAAVRNLMHENPEMTVEQAVKKLGFEKGPSQTSGNGGKSSDCPEKPQNLEPSCDRQSEGPNPATDSGQGKNAGAGGDDSSRSA